MRYRNWRERVPGRPVSARARVGRCGRLAAGATTVAILGWGAMVATGGAVPAALARPAATLAAAASVGSGCETLPASSSSSSAASPAATASAQASPSASPSPAATPSRLCVSVLRGEAGIKAGQTATFTVSVWAENGPVPSVTVSLSASPSGLSPVFAGTCPGGNGASTCALGPLATDVTPTAYQLQVSVKVPASASATSVSLTAVASAATSPAMSVLPGSVGTVSVTPAPRTSSSSSPKPSKSAKPSGSSRPKPSSASPAPTTAAPVVGVTSLPPLGPMPTTGGATSVVGPGNADGMLPSIAATTQGPAVPAVPPPATVPPTTAGLPPSSKAISAADASDPQFGFSTTAGQAVGLMALAIAFLLVTTRVWVAKRPHGRHALLAAAGAGGRNPAILYTGTPAAQPSVPPNAASSVPPSAVPAVAETEVIRPHREPAPHTQTYPGEYLG